MIDHKKGPRPFRTEYGGRGLFVQFLAFLFPSKLKEHRLATSFPLKELPKKFDNFDRIQRPSKRPRIEELTKQELMCFDLLVIDDSLV